ncbi:BREX-2 system phosphatase PglZ [Luteitalea sp. TBR-22]|uniref:BREX-2 system phosphatase PglZ n=1 Tax=Luteitalea sp. TBR-22 TaxID=2802971 RepID=UPI001EF712BA|nr:BREX-2 system phosphatase PglZ [Luteitalea sp. TBR-22]
MQHVRAIRSKLEGHSGGQPAGAPHVFALRSAAAWTGPASLDVEGQPVDVVAAVSALHVRELLAARVAGMPDLVVITPLAEAELGADVMARLAGRRVVSLEPWTLVLEAFRARDLDARLLAHRWMALALLEGMPATGYPPVPAGVLDSETAWSSLLQQRLGLAVAQPDVVALLEWAADPSHVERWRQLPADVRDGVRAWLVQHLGDVASLIVDAAALGHDALALGLVCDVLFHEWNMPSGAPGLRSEARDAAIRFESFIGGRPLPEGAGLAWSRAAVAIASRPRDPRQAGVLRVALDNAERALKHLQADALAVHSDVLPSGFDRRCEVFGEALLEYLRDPEGRRDDVHDARGHLRAHRSCTLPSNKERLERLEMSLRLARWLNERASDVPGSIGEAAWAQVQQDGLADWARAVARSVDPSAAVADACRAVLEAVRQAVRRRQDAFATKLAHWLELGTDPGVLLVERVLEARVAPLAAHAPVLLLVMDGMSAGTCLELAHSLVEDGWTPLATEGRSSPEPVLALLPSLTAVCRTSLLSGRVVEGAAADESRNFAAHAGLVARSTPALPPVLFHKAGLAEDHGALQEPLRKALGNPKQRVVGVVVNAIDDHLLKADQVRNRWTISDVPMLSAILSDARAAGRIVVLTSDHGHILDDRSTQRSGGAGTSDRWRPADTPAGDGEVLVSGPRVIAPGHACVLAVSEQLRYRSKKNGYHGGGTPQEVVAPLVVLASGATTVPGWEETALPAPDWWMLEYEDLRVYSAPVQTSQDRPARRAGPTPPSPSKPLLSLVDDEPAAPAGPAADTSLAARLLQSEVYAAQKAQQARAAVPDERVKAILGFLLARGGRSTRAAVASALGIPKPRLDLQLGALRGVLNVEGYAVLSIDEAGDTVTLNRDYLMSQFDLH